MGEVVPTLSFVWERDTGSLIAHCSACPWYVSNTGHVPDIEVRDQAIVLVTRKHVLECAVHSKKRKTESEPSDAE